MSSFHARVLKDGVAKIAKKLFRRLAMIIHVKMVARATTQMTAISNASVWLVGLVGSVKNRLIHA